MGLHTTPQEFLGHFACPYESDLIWAYDKKSREYRKLPIKNVAQARGFYSADDERMLSDEIEAPAQGPLNQLRQGEPIGESERKAVSLYLASMTVRGPRAKRQRLDIATRYGENIIREYWEEVGIVPDEQAIFATMKPYREGTVAKADPVISSQDIAYDRAELIERMVWSVRLMRDSMLITSDHPIFFDENAGMRDVHKGYMTIAIAHNVGIVTSWSGAEGTTEFIEETSENNLAFERYAKEMNRRMVFQADRFVFCREPVSWLRKMARNPMWNRRQVAEPPAV